MKTYKEFITELNKFELMLKAGKTGLKMFKGKKPSHSTIIGLRSKFGNRFVSPRREAENLMKGFQVSQNMSKKAGKGGAVTGSLETAARQFGGAQGMRFHSKKGLKELDKLYRTNRPQDRHYRSVIKNMGTQNRQIYQRPYPATTDAQDFMNKADVFQSKNFPIFPKNKLGAPTTTNIKKGSIPEPKKRKLRKEEVKVPPVTGLGGGGGGTDSITDKAKTKSLGKKIKDVGKILTFPFHKRRKDPTEKFASEEVMASPTNSVGGGQIAGTVEAGDNPPVKKKKRYIYGGTGSRKMWMNNK